MSNGDIQRIDTITNSQVAQNVSGDMVQNIDTINNGTQFNNCNFYKNTEKDLHIIDIEFDFEVDSEIINPKIIKKIKNYLDYHYSFDFKVINSKVNKKELREKIKIMSNLSFSIDFNDKIKLLFDFDEDITKIVSILYNNVLGLDDILIDLITDIVKNKRSHNNISLSDSIALFDDDIFYIKNKMEEINLKLHYSSLKNFQKILTNTYFK
jgi:hypothetical protein